MPVVPAAVEKEFLLLYPFIALSSIVTHLARLPFVGLHKWMIGWVVVLVVLTIPFAISALGRWVFAWGTQGGAFHAALQRRRCASCSRRRK